jgi:sugar lactone lactonase YvrE
LLNQSGVAKRRARLVLSVLPPLAVVAVIGTAGVAGAAVSAHSTAAAAASTSPGAKGAAAAPAATGPSTSTPTTATATATSTATTPADDGTLSAVSTSVAAGATLTFNYALGSTADVNAENWIGIYQNPGCGPVNQTYDCESKTYNWITNASGGSSFNTTGWAPGNYVAYFLYANGYTWLAKPVTFTITAAVGAPTDDGTLTTSTDSVEQGAPITFDYAVGESSAVNSENWVGLYSDPGCGPANQTYDCGSTTYNWTADASGATTFSTASLAPGNYIAYFLYDNGYTWLAKPVTFTVTKAKPIPAPTYKGTFTDGLSAPAGLAVDGKGDVWVTNSGENRVIEYSASGKKLRQFGRTGSAAGQLDDPTAIAVDASGNVYVADTGNNRVEEFNTASKFVRAYSTANGTALDSPQGVAVDGKGDVYVSDTENNRVVEFSATGAYVQSETSGLTGPEGLTLDASGDLWVANAGQYDEGGEQVAELSTSGGVLIQIGGDTSSDLGGLSNPSDVALDAEGHVFIAEPDYSLVDEFDVTGPYGNEFGATDLSGALAVAVAPDGDIFVADTGNGRIVEYTPSASS